MDEDNKLSNAIKIPVFSGKERDFHVWWVQFQAYCTMKKIAESLKEDFDLPADPTTITETDTEIKKLKNLVAQNAAAVACLTIAFTTSELLEFCTDSATDEYPAGIAKDIVKKLFTKYHLVDVVAGVEAKLTV